MYFCTRNGEEYLSNDGLALTKNKSDAMRVDPEYISSRNNYIVYLVRFKSNDKYLSCLDEKISWISNKDDSTIFINIHGFYVSIGNQHISLGKNGLNLHNFIDIHDDRVGIANCGFSPSLFLSY